MAKMKIINSCSDCDTPTANGKCYYMVSRDEPHDLDVYKSAYRDVKKNMDNGTIHPECPLDDL